MKRLKQALLPLCTLALAALGAAMPWLSAQMEDQRVSALREEFDLNAVSLTLRQDAGAADTLRLLGEPYTCLTWEGETVYAWQDIQRAAYDVSRQLAETGLTLRPDSGGGVVAPQLALSEDGALSAMIWYVVWGEDSGSYAVMDDMTGKMVSGLFPRAGKLNIPQFNEQILDWADFCEDYYGVTVANMEWTDKNPVVDGELIGGSTLVMTFQPEQGDPFEVRLTFHERMVEFNAQKEPTNANSMAK